MKKLKAAKRSLKDQWYLLAATLVVSSGMFALMATPATAAPAAMDDCSLVRVSRGPVDLITNTVENMFRAFWGQVALALFTIGLIAAAITGGGAKGRAGWLIRGAALLVIAAVAYVAFSRELDAGGSVCA